MYGNVPFPESPLLVITGAREAEDQGGISKESSIPEVLCSPHGVAGN